MRKSPFGLVPRCVVALALVLGGIAGGGVIYHNGETDLSHLVPSVWDRFQVCDDFMIGAPATVRGIHWWGTAVGEEDPGPGPDPVTWMVRFYPMEGRDPSRTWFAEYIIDGVSREYVGDYAGGSQEPGPYPVSIFLYHGNVPARALDPGWYALSISPSEGWSWATSSRAGSSWQRGALSDPWDPASVELAFYLTDDHFLGRGLIPEPTTLTLLAIGGMGLLRRRRNPPGAAWHP